MYFTIKVKHAIMVEAKKGAYKKVVTSNYCVGDEVLEGALAKANAYFAENIKEHMIKSISDCVISTYIGDTTKKRMFQCRIHWQSVADNGNTKIITEYVLVDANNMHEAEKIVDKHYKDATMDYEIYSLTTAKIKEVLD